MCREASCVSDCVSVAHALFMKPLSQALCLRGSGLPSRRAASVVAYWRKAAPRGEMIAPTCAVREQDAGNAGTGV